MAVISNKPQGSCVLHFNANSGNIIVAGNNSVSNVATGSEVLTGASIRKITFGAAPSGTAYWTVARGANVVAVCDGTGILNFTGEFGAALNLFPAANLVCTLTGSTNGFIMVELAKIGTLDTGGY